MLRTMDRFIDRGNFQLAYRVIGKSKIPLILCDGIGCVGFAWKALFEEFGNTFSFIRWHYRGHGQTGKPANPLPHDFSMDKLCEDLNIILERENITQAILLGHSMGSQVVLEFGLRYPEKALALVPICGAYGSPFQYQIKWRWLSKFLPQAIEQVRKYPQIRDYIKALGKFPYWHEVGTIIETNGKLLKKEYMVDYFPDITNIDPESFLMMAEQMNQHSVEQQFDQIQQPTLVVYGEHDGFTPAMLSEKMVRKLPNAEACFLPLCSHMGHVELKELFHLKLEKFLYTHFNKNDLLLTNHKSSVAA